MVGTSGTAEVFEEKSLESLLQERAIRNRMAPIISCERTTRCRARQISGFGLTGTIYVNPTRAKVSLAFN
jgi:hypothetical protein